MNPLSFLSSLGKLASNQFNRLFSSSPIGINSLFSPGSGLTSTVLPNRNFTSSKPQSYPQVTQQPVDINAALQSGGLSGPTGLVGSNGQPVPVPQTSQYRPADVIPPQQYRAATGGAPLPVTPQPFQMSPVEPQRAAPTQPQPTPQQPTQESDVTVPTAFAQTPLDAGSAFMSGGMSTGMGGSGFYNNSVLAALMQALQGGWGTGGMESLVEDARKKNKKKNTQNDLQRLQMIGAHETYGTPLPDAYGVTGATGDLGRYQVSPPTLQTYAPLILGRDVSPEEFLSNGQLQEQFAVGYWNHLKSLGFTDDEATRAWNLGIRGAGDPEKKQLGDDYLAKVLGRTALGQ